MAFISLSITSLWPVAFTAFCAANTAPQVSQYLPSVNPSSVQVAATFDRFLSVLLYLYNFQNIYFSAKTDSNPSSAFLTVSSMIFSAIGFKSIFKI